MYCAGFCWPSHMRINMTKIYSGIYVAIPLVLSNHDVNIVLHVTCTSSYMHGRGAFFKALARL